MITNNEKILTEWLNKPPVQWEEACDTLRPDQLMELESLLSHATQHLARATFYVNARALGLIHPSSVKDQNLRIRLVRKAIGYTIARDDVNF